MMERVMGLPDINLIKLRCDGGCIACDSRDTTAAHVHGKRLMVADGKKHHRYMNVIPLCWSHHYIFYDAKNLVVLAMRGWTVTARLENARVEVTACRKVLDVKDGYLDTKNREAIMKLRALIPSVRKKVEAVFAAEGT